MLLVPDACSSSASKYFRRGARLNWPEGAVSRESIRAVRKLDRLKVELICFYDWHANLMSEGLYNLHMH